jgi:hypothetical protein
VRRWVLRFGPLVAQTSPAKPGQRKSERSSDFLGCSSPK